MAKVAIPPEKAEELKTNLKISLFLRTREKEGLVFYIGNDMDPEGPLTLTYIAMAVANGSLIVLVKLRPENQVFQFNFTDISDGKQRLVQLHWEATKLDVWVDDVHHNYTVDNQYELDAAYIQFGMMKDTPKAATPTGSTARRKKRQAPTAQNEPLKPWDAGAFKGTIQVCRLLLLTGLEP